MDFGLRVVSINSRSPPHVRVAVLLHECGHVLVCRSRLASPTRRVCEMSLKEWVHDKGRGKPRTSARRLAILCEEGEAWNRGWALGVRLRIRLNACRYERVRTACLLTYLRWAALSNA